MSAGWLSKISHIQCVEVLKCETIVEFLQTRTKKADKAFYDSIYFNHYDI